VVVPRYLGPDVDLMLQCNLALAVLWGCILVVSIFWYHWRGLWLLLGVPFACLLARWFLAAGAGLRTESQQLSVIAIF
jgi:hypothetical protein